MFNRTTFAQFTARALALLLAAGLLGCAGNAPQPAPNAPATGDPLAAHGLRRPTGLVLTREQRLEAQRNHGPFIPMAARKALQALGIQQPSAPHVPKRRVSVDLPWFEDARTEYAGPGTAGWLALHNASPGAAFMNIEPTGDGPAGMGYVIYRIDDVNPVPKTLRLQATAADDDPIGIAVYNWGYGSLGRWEPLHYALKDANDEAVAALDSVAGAQWTNANGDFAFVVFSLAPYQPGIVSWTLTETTSNIAPNATIRATPGSGPAPLATVLDATDSNDDDGSVVGFRFDPLGDGNWIDNGTDPTFDYSYDTPGAYHPSVEVIDDGGLTTIATTTVVASPLTYSETEHNDSNAGANAFPALPFTGWYGNVGVGPGGYDKDMADYYEFDASFGDEVHFQVNYSPDDSTHGENFFVRLTDSFDQILAISEAYPMSALVYTFQGFEIGPFYLSVHNNTGETDYLITGDDTVYEESTPEDNDSIAAADRLDNLTDFHAMINFDGSLGSGPGYPGHDGDHDDYYYFGAVVNQHLSYTLEYDSATANIEVYLTDFNGVELDSSTSGSGVETIEYDFTTEQQPFYLHVHTSAGDYSDYRQNATLTLTNPGYSEQEENDYPQVATPLGDPFNLVDFTGNIGNGGDYDGDTDDYFTFNASPGDKIKFVITPSDTTPLMQGLLFDSDYRSIGVVETNPTTGVLTARALIRLMDSGPFFLQLTNTGSSLNYSIDGSADVFDEVEDNDDNVQANDLGSTESLPFFSGSLGTGGSNHDGDTIDVFSFGADQGTTATFTFFYDDGTGIIDVVMKDADGDEIGFADGGSGTLTIDNTVPFGPADTAPYYLEVTTVTQYADYWIQRSPAF